MFTVYSGGEIKDQKREKEEFTKEIDDETKVIKKKNSRFFPRRNTIEELDDKSNVTEKEESKTSTIRIPLKNPMMNQI